MAIKIKNMQINWTKVGVILAIITALTSGAITIYGVIDARYAKAEEVHKIKAEVDVLKLRNLVNGAQDAYYHAKKMLRFNPDDEEAKEEAEDARKEYKELKKRLIDTKLKQ